MCPAAARFRSRSTRLSGLCMPAKSVQAAGEQGTPLPLATALYGLEGSSRKASNSKQQQASKLPCSLLHAVRCSRNGKLPVLLS